MKIETSDFLRLVEGAGTLACFDIEATGLRGDYNSVLVVSIKPYKREPITFKVEQAGNDKKVVREAGDCLGSFDCIVSYYGKGFDIKMLNTRRLKWGLGPLPSVPHIDLYYSGKAHLLTARRSQGHLLAWLGAPEQKMTVGADMWNEILTNKKEAMKIMVDRCESDCAGLEALYDRLKHTVKDIKR